MKSSSMLTRKWFGAVVCGCRFLGSGDQCRDYLRPTGSKNSPGWLRGPKRHCGFADRESPSRSAPFFPLVTQGSKTPYSQEKIQASADALKKAGNFKEVRVEVVPDITGLRVSFLLEPSFYLGVLQFPGAVKRFSYIRLLQVANLSDEDPYDPSRITVAEIRSRTS